MKKREIFYACWEMIDKLSVSFDRQKKLELLEELRDEADKRISQIENAMEQLGEASESDTEVDWEMEEENVGEDD